MKKKCLNCEKHKGLEQFAWTSKGSGIRKTLCKRCIYLKGKHKLNIDKDLFEEWRYLMRGREWNTNLY